MGEYDSLTRVELIEIVNRQADEIARLEDEIARREDEMERVRSVLTGWGCALTRHELSQCCTHDTLIPFVLWHLGARYAEAGSRHARGASVRTT